jgi:hypothetical protein
MTSLEETEKQISLVLQALASQGVETRCARCGVTEWVIPLDDQPWDPESAESYLCEDCEGSDQETPKS